MTDAFLVYLGDAWLSTGSLRPIAICTSLQSVERIALQRLPDLTPEELGFLESNFQTQGRSENLYVQRVQFDTCFAD